MAKTLNRSIESWEKCDPTGMSSMSKAAICYAIIDAKHDILKLYEWLGISCGKRDKLSAINAELESDAKRYRWLRDRYVTVDAGLMLIEGSGKVGDTAEALALDIAIDFELSNAK